MDENILKEELMEIYKNPTKRGRLKNSSVQVGKKNPICGDDVNLQLKIENGIVKDAAFDGSACFVSIVSSEVLFDYIIGKPLDEVKKITKDDLLKLVGLNLTTSRVTCATLALSALESAIKEYEEKRN